MQKWILNYDGLSLLDLSDEMMSNFDSQTVVEMGPLKYLYLGSELPLTSLYLDQIASATGAAMSMEYWTHNGWEPVRYLRDHTMGMSQSGYIKFEGYREKPWVAVSNSSEITELSSRDIYDRYWCRFSLDLDATVQVEWLGHKFCSSADLLREYPTLRTPSALRVFGDSKTDWEDETKVASELMMEDMLNKQSMTAIEQLVEPSRLKSACVARTAALIYGGMGDAGVDDELRAMAKYESRLTPTAARSDKDMDGVIDKEDTAPSEVTFRR